MFLEAEGDNPEMINYYLIMRGDGRPLYLWPVSTVRWDLERSGSKWRIRRRTNRLLDETGAGSQLFAASLPSLFAESEE